MRLDLLVHADGGDRQGDMQPGQLLPVDICLLAGKALGLSRGQIKPYPKSRAGRRSVPVPGFAVELLAAHREAFPAGPRGEVTASQSSRLTHGLVRKAVALAGQESLLPGSELDPSRAFRLIIPHMFRILLAEFVAKAGETEAPSAGAHAVASMA
ncbi:hypothetical protein AB0C02_17865 [Micromonospora sp. NPDC048999]|uniref:hypothetical protein n=1 Tax=Micromonospora sp. NPDC048999 TaxID=3155391 RepID=UPI0033CC6772